MFVYVLLREVVGGEEEDCDSSKIVAIMSDATVISDRVPDKFCCVDPEYIDCVWDVFDCNTVERYVIRRFDLETGDEADDIHTVLWPVEDFRALGLDISD